MQENYSQRLEMQIPQENIYTGLEITQKDNTFNEFLKNHFKFPSNNFDEVKRFINNDKEMKKIVNDLPTILSKEMDYNELSLDFMKETDPSEKILEIIIYSELESRMMLQKEDLICDMVIDKYPRTILEYIILVEPYDRQ